MGRVARSCARRSISWRARGLCDVIGCGPGNQPKRTYPSRIQRVIRCPAPHFRQTAPGRQTATQPGSRQRHGAARDSLLSRTHGRRRSSLGPTPRRNHEPIERLRMMGSLIDDCLQETSKRCRICGRNMAEWLKIHTLHHRFPRGVRNETSGSNTAVELAYGSSQR